MNRATQLGGGGEHICEAIYEARSKKCDRVRAKNLCVTLFVNSPLFIPVALKRNHRRNGEQPLCAMCQGFEIFIGLTPGVCEVQPSCVKPLSFLNGSPELSLGN